MITRIANQSTSQRPSSRSCRRQDTPSSSSSSSDTAEEPDGDYRPTCSRRAYTTGWRMVTRGLQQVNFEASHSGDAVARQAAGALSVEGGITELHAAPSSSSSKVARKTVARGSAAKRRTSSVLSRASARRSQTASTSRSASRRDTSRKDEACAAIVGTPEHSRSPAVHADLAFGAGVSTSSGHLTTVDPVDSCSEQSTPTHSIPRAPPYFFPQRPTLHSMKPPLAVPTPLTVDTPTSSSARDCPIGLSVSSARLQTRPVPASLSPPRGPFDLAIDAPTIPTASSIRLLPSRPIVACSMSEGVSTVPTDNVTEPQHAGTATGLDPQQDLAQASRWHTAVDVWLACGSVGLEEVKAAVTLVDCKHRTGSAPLGGALSKANGRRTDEPRTAPARPKVTLAHVPARPSPLREQL